MDGRLIAALAALGGALLLATAVGLRVRRGRTTTAVPAPATPEDTAALGLSPTGPTIVHFTAPWCGPCAAVRRVVERVTAELPDVGHTEIDIEAQPALARRFSVLSLPTTLVFDGDGRQRYRTTAVPRPADLRDLLRTLLA